MTAQPFDWQSDPEYADPVPDVLGAADDARTAGRERGLTEPEAQEAGRGDPRAPGRDPVSGSASPPSLEWAANLARLTYETLKPGKASLR